MRLFHIIWISCVFAFSANAANLEAIEQKMVDLQDDIVDGKTDDIRKAASQDLRKLLMEAFEEEGVFEYHFENLFRVASITSPDKAFRLFNWNRPHLDGTYSYYALLLLPQKGKYIELDDKGELSQDLANQTLKADKWYGALYYEIFPVHHKRESYYVLMGWDGNNRLSNKKVLDVLSFDKKGNVTLGKPVFQTTTGTAHRIILEYAKQARVNLRYMSSKDAIIYDRLEPEKAGLAGQYAYYIPSTAYDGYQLNKSGTWDLIEFIDMSRPESEEKGAEFNFPERMRFDRHQNNVVPTRGRRE